MPTGNLLDLLERADQRRNPAHRLAVHFASIAIQIAAGTTAGLGLGVGFAFAWAVL